MPHSSAARELAELQERFFRAITEPLPERVRRRRGRRGRGDQDAPSSEIAQLLRSGKNESAIERLKIYRHGYFARLTECLSDDYPVSRDSMGVDAFDACCRDYIRECPSRSPSLNQFGCRFPEFLAQRARSHRTFHAELARLEWTLVEVLHAPAAARLTAGAMESVAANELAELRLVTNPSLRLLTFDYPVNAYYQAARDAEAPLIPAQARCHLAVVRHDVTIWRLDLNDENFCVLSRLARGEPLGRALHGILAQAPELRAWFAEWTQ
ncbi:MAG TPA: DNA-binding domain-containing protein, partial [Polyangiaceae bacterium]